MIIFWTDTHKTVAAEKNGVFVPEENFKFH